MTDRDTTNPVTTFIDEGWITEVLFRVKSGKEATVYCCAAHPDRDAAFFALKVYTPPDQRSFKSAALYNEGRFSRASRQGRAMHNKSAKGREMLSSRWRGTEFSTLQTLHAAGCDVVKPIAICDGAVLLEFIASDDDIGQPAPQLVKQRFTPEQATPLYGQALVTIERILGCHFVHGDLSPYNILYAGGRLRFIDFPQSVDARHNSNARMLLERDVSNVAQHFARLGCVTDPVGFSAELWRRYTHAEL